MLLFRYHFILGSSDKRRRIEPSRRVGCQSSKFTTCGEISVQFTHFGSILYFSLETFK